MKKFLLISIFLIHLPPFVLLTRQLSVYRISELIILSSFFYYIFFKKNKKNLNKKGQKISFLFVLFFLSQSISIISALDIKLFLNRYEIIFFFIIFSGVLINYLNKKRVKEFVNFLIFCLIFQVFFELIFFISPLDIKSNVLSFLHHDASEIISFNINRNRNYLESYLFLLTPLILFKLSNNKNFLFKLFLSSLVVLILFLSLVSGFRIYLILFVLGFLISIFFLNYQKAEKKYIFLITFLILIIIFTYLVFFNKSFIFKRFFIFTNEEAYTSLISRVDMWKNALQIGLSSPIFGIGLGNYSLYQGAMVNKVKFSTNYQFFKNATLQAFDDPHNIFLSIFSQTGIIGLISIILILLYFLKQDLACICRLMLRKKINLSNGDFLLKISLMTSFWLLFVYLLFHPFNTIRSFFYFSFLRLLIVKLN